jgi:hypothetical protein
MVGKLISSFIQVRSVLAQNRGWGGTIANVYLIAGNSNQNLAAKPESWKSEIYEPEFGIAMCHHTYRPIIGLHRQPQKVGCRIAPDPFSVLPASRRKGRSHR